MSQLLLVHGKDGVDKNRPLELQVLQEDVQATGTLKLNEGNFSFFTFLKNLFFSRRKKGFKTLIIGTRKLKDGGTVFSLFLFLAKFFFSRGKKGLTTLIISYNI